MMRRRTRRWFSAKVFGLPILLTTVGTVIAGASPDKTITFDLAQKSDTKTVAAGEYVVRIIHAKQDKSYLRSDGQKLARGKPSDTPAACADTSVKNDIDSVAADPAKSEADIKSAIDTFVDRCKPNGRDLREAIDTRTALSVGTFSLDNGASVGITINDSSGSPWTFTIRESHVDLDLAASSGAFVVAPGEVKLRLINALPGQTYDQLPDGASVTVPTTPLDTKDCTGIDDALKSSTEATAASKITDALKNCADADKKSITSALAAVRTQPFGTITTQSGDSGIVRLQRRDKAEKWTFSVTGNGPKVVADDSSSTETDKLKRELAKATISGLPPTTSVTCKVTDDLCPAIYVSASAQSLITITDVASHYSGPVKVVVTAGETWKRQVKPRSFIKTFPRAPAQIVISVHNDRKSRALPIADENQESAITRSNSTDDDFAIDFTTLGRSEQLAATIIGQDGREHAINTTIRYQRWFVDTGGFIVLTTVADEEVTTMATTDGQVKVTKRRNNDKLTPGTGAVLDFHPANYPKWAVFQFGLATSQGRPLSYYLGSGYRVLEVGANALATVAVGLAAVPSTRFPDLQATDVRAVDDPALKGKTVYRFGPYVSFSFGFRFGDVPPAASNSATAGQVRSQ